MTTGLEIGPDNDNTASSKSDTLPIGIWIGLATAALLIVCILTVIACYILKFRRSTQATEEVHHYDHIDSHGIYSETLPNTTDRQPALPTLPATDVPLRDTEPYYTSILYSQPVRVTDEPQDYLTAMQTLDRMEMTTNVAYKNHGDFENSREYI